MSCLIERDNQNQIQRVLVENPVLILKPSLGDIEIIGEILEKSPRGGIREVAEVEGVKAENIQGLYDINRDIFDLTQDQAVASAIVSDKIVEQIAGREGVSKNEIYDKITFKKEDKAPPKSLKQQTSDIWHSNISAGLSEISQKSATSHQWVKMIIDKGGRGTAQEAEWIGLEDYLNTYQEENKVKSIPRKVVEDYVRDNQFNIVDVVRNGRFVGTYQEALAALDVGLEVYDAFDNPIKSKEEIDAYVKQLGQKAFFNLYIGGKRMPNEELRITEGDNYREFLLTLPRIEQDYRGEHYPNDKNVLAHIRLADKKAEGKKILFIEEIQSDWAMQGEKEGFDIYKPYTYEIREIVAPTGKTILAIFRDGESINFYKLNERKKAEQRLERYKKEQPALSIPEMPYKKTNQWAAMSFRRVLKMAVNGGYDAISWGSSYEDNPGVARLYNEVYPNIFRKEAQRFDKETQLESIDFGKTGFLRRKTNEQRRLGKRPSITITSEMRMNLESSIPLFQSDQGAMLASNGNYIIYSLTNPNVTTPLHELAHVYENYLTEQEKDVVLNWTGQDEWTTETSEKFARGFEKYLSEGKSPIKALQGIFDRFRQWLLDIYNGIRGSNIDLELNDAMRNIYDVMVGSEVQPTDTLESELFDSIASLPLVDSLDSAFDVYKNIYSPKFLKSFGDWKISGSINSNLVYETGEPKLFYLTPNGTVTESYEEALKNTSDGDIKLGVLATSDVFVVNNENKFNSFTNDVVLYNGRVKLNDKNKFIEIASVTSNSDPTTVPGFINHGIRQGKIDGRRRKVNNEYLLQGKGALESTSILNSQLALWDGIVYLGKNNISRNTNGTFTITETDPTKVILANSQGELVTVDKDNIISDLRNGKYQDLENKYPDIDAIIYQIFRERNDLDSIRTLDEFSESVEYSESEVQGKLLDFLNNMGVEVTSISDYVSRYNQVHGVDPSAEALADIANSVVAFAEGSADVENLAEETAHFAIEAFEDQQALQPALDNVHLTQEWANESQRYYNVYHDQYQGDELDNIVRREILGKILAKKLKDNFSTADTTSEATTVIDTLRDLWNSFINRIREFFTPSRKNEVEEITDLIANDVLNNQAEQVFDKDLLKTSRFVMYSLSDKAALLAIKSAGQKLVAENKRLKATKTGSLDVAVRKINKIIENNNKTIDAYDQWLAIKHIMSALNPQIRRMDKLIKRNQKDIERGVETKALYLNHEQLQAMRSLTDDFKPILSELASLVEAGRIKEVPQVNSKTLVAEMREIVSKIDALAGQANIQHEQGVDNIMDRLIYEYNLPEKTEARLREYIEREFKDTTWFQANYGSLEHAANPFLGALGKIINTNNNNAQTRWRNVYNPLLKKIQQEGFNLSKFRDIIEFDSKGRPTGFTLSPYDWGKFYDELKTVRLNAVKSILGLKESIEQLEKLDRKNKIPTVDEMTEEQAQKYRQALEDWFDDNTEKRYLDEFYQKREKRYTELGIRDVTREFLKEISRERAIILSKYRDSDGNIDFTTIDENDLDALEELALRRKAAKAEFDDNGDRKIDIDLTISEDLKKLDEDFKENKRSFKIKNRFFENLEKIQRERGNQAAFEWLKANGGIAFNQDFWEGLQLNRKSIVEKLSDLLPEVEEQSAQDGTNLRTTISVLDELLKKKTEILKQYQKPNNPAEIDYDNMSRAAENTIREIENQLQSAFRDANTILRKYDESEVVDPLVRTENTINDSYGAALQDSGENEFEFVLKHVTESDSLLVRNFKNKLDMIVSGQPVFLERSLKRFVADRLGLESEMDLDAVDLTQELANVNVEQMATDFAKTRVFSYFKRFAPEGYDEFYKRLKRGDIDVVKVVKGEFKGDEDVTRYIDFNPNFAWTEDEAGESFLNPNYVEDFPGGIRQPKLSKFRNQKYFSKFAPDEQGNPTRATGEYEMLQALWDAKNIADEAFEIAGVANQYQLPMISRGQVEKIYDLKGRNTVGTVKEIFNDTFANRVDTLDYGEQTGDEDAIDQKNFRIIPRYYVRMLENVSDVSTELAYSYGKYLESAFSYEQRVSSVADALALQQHLLNSRLEGGKSYSGSNTIKMFNHFMDNQFYGFRQVKKVNISLPTGHKIDVSRLMLVIDRMIRDINIRFNIPIAATGFTTGTIFRKIEAAVGEYTQSGSAKFAERESRKQMAGLVKEAGQIDRTTKLYRMLEASRILDIDNRLKASGFGRGVRFFNNLGYEFHIMGDILIKSRVLISVLDDFRLVNGRFTTFNNFKLMSENEGLSKSELKEKWATFKDKTMYGYIENGENDIKFNQELIDQLGEKEINSQWNRAIALAQRTSASVDGVVSQEDKSVASRHFLMQFTVAHRGWLTTAIQKRAKRNHYNFMTGQFEEGYYRSLAKYFEGVYGNLRKEGFKDMLKMVKEEYSKLDPEQQRNLKRVMIEMGTFMFMVAIGMLVAGLADDRDNKDIWALQFAAYIYFRTVSELGSIQAPTGLFGLMDVVETPFVGMNTLQQLADIKGWSFDPVTSGAYKGHSKLYRKIMKVTWGRHYYDILNIKPKSDYFRLLNSETLLTLAK